VTTEALFRTLAAAAALVAGRRGGRAGVAAAGALGGFAVFGATARPFPEPAEAAVLVAALALLFIVAFSAAWSPITGEAVPQGALLAIPAALFAAIALRGQAASMLLSGAFVVLLATSLFAALGTLASAESGWRKPVLWTASLALPALVAFGLDALLAASPLARRPAVAAGAGPRGRRLAARSSWAGAVKNRLREEVPGLCPRRTRSSSSFRGRALEKRLGRPTSGTIRVSALLLAVARHQQRRGRRRRAPASWKRSRSRASAHA
jgi:hypothetical protein